MAKKIRLILREIVIFAGIYAAWSIYVGMNNLHANLDNDALVPCLFFFPPIGLYIAYFIIIKYGIFEVIRAFIKKRKRNS